MMTSVDGFIAGPDGNVDWMISPDEDRQAEGLCPVLSKRDRTGQERFVAVSFAGWSARHDGGLMRILGTPPPLKTRLSRFQDRCLTRAGSSPYLQQFTGSQAACSA